MTGCQAWFRDQGGTLNQQGDALVPEPRGGRAAEATDNTGRFDDESR